MAYEKQTWACGDEISAEKLNHMEDGIYDASQSGGGTSGLPSVEISESDSVADIFGKVKEALDYTEGDIYLKGSKVVNFAYAYTAGDVARDVNIGNRVVRYTNISLDDYISFTNVRNAYALNGGRLMYCQLQYREMTSASSASCADATPIAE